MSAEDKGSDGPSRRDLLDQIDMESSRRDGYSERDTEPTTGNRRGFLTGTAMSGLAGLGLINTSGSSPPTQQPDASLVETDELHSVLDERQDIIDALEDEGFLQDNEPDALSERHSGSLGVLSKFTGSLSLGVDERAVKRSRMINDIQEEFVEFLHDGPQGTLRIEFGVKEGIVRISPPDSVDDQAFIETLNETVPLTSGDCGSDYEVPCSCPNESGCKNITESRCDEICGGNYGILPSPCTSCDCVAITCCDCDCNCWWSYTCDCEGDFCAGSCNNAFCC